MKGKTELKEGDVEADDGQAGHDEPRPAAAGLVLEGLKQRNLRDKTQRTERTKTKT